MVQVNASLEDLLESKLRAASQSWSLPANLSMPRGDTPTAIGVDTNVLKRLRGVDPLVVDRLAQRMKSSGAKLVVPGQSMTEFWNRHQTFTEDVLNPVRTSLTSSLDRLDEVRGIVAAPEKIDGLIEDIKELLQNVVAASPVEAMRKTVSFWAALESCMLVPYCDRARFIHIVETRQRTKHPPGFADEKTKQNALGDSFVWLDLLLGITELLDGVDVPSLASREVWFVTDDRKSDWWSGNHAHPILVHEAMEVCGIRLQMLTTQELLTWSRSGAKGGGA